MEQRGGAAVSLKDDRATWRLLLANTKIEDRSGPLIASAAGIVAEIALVRVVAMRVPGSGGAEILCFLCERLEGVEIQPDEKEHRLCGVDRVSVRHPTTNHRGPI